MNTSNAELKNYILSVPETKCSSDSFLCSSCGLRMILKIYGDTTPCRQCDGVMHRVK